jgi:hypothetical protein
LPEREKSSAIPAMENRIFPEIILFIAYDFGFK